MFFGILEGILGYLSFGVLPMSGIIFNSNVLVFIVFLGKGRILDVTIELFSERVFTGGIIDPQVLKVVSFLIDSYVENDIKVGWSPGIWYCEVEGRFSFCHFSMVIFSLVLWDN